MECIIGWGGKRSKTFLKGIDVIEDLSAIEKHVTKQLLASRGISIWLLHSQYCINPIRIRQNFLINGPGGIDSTQHIQTLITPELQKIKNPFLLSKKFNFLTKSLNFLTLYLPP